MIICVIIITIASVTPLLCYPPPPISSAFYVLYHDITYIVRYSYSYDVTNKIYVITYFVLLCHVKYIIFIIISSIIIYYY